MALHLLLPDVTDSWKYYHWCLNGWPVLWRVTQAAGCTFCQQTISNLISAPLFSNRPASAGIRGSFYSGGNLTVSLCYSIGIIEVGQMIKRPITINAGEIKNSSHLLHLSFSDINHSPSLIYPRSCWGCLGMPCLFKEKSSDISKENKDLRRWRQPQTRRRRRRSRGWWWFRSIRAGPDEMWQSATLLKHLLISMTQLSRPYFSKIKRPYGKLACPQGRGRGLERTYVPVNE